jgi:hypothetical protein
VSVSDETGTIDAPTPKNAPTGSRFVTVEYFWREMLGLGSKGWYYNHANDPGMPKRVYFGVKPMLLYEECLAYIDRAIEDRGPVYPPKPQQQKKNPAKKRRVGRPVKEFKRSA